MHPNTSRRGGFQGKRTPYGTAQGRGSSYRQNGDKDKGATLLDIEGIRDSPTRILEVCAAFKRQVMNSLLDQPEVLETIKHGRPVDIEAREKIKFRTTRRDGGPPGCTVLEANSTLP